jgi:mono/diheme cytochrome c family protein
MKSIAMPGAVAALALAACSNGTPTPQATLTVTATQPAPTKEEIVAHGKYIVEGIGGCNDCHTPMGPNGPDMTKMLAGADLAFKPISKMPWAPKAPALAGLPVGYTEAGVAKLLMDGTPEDASPPLPPMPAFRLNPADATAVAAYLASLPKPAAAVPATTPAPAKPK